MLCQVCQAPDAELYQDGAYSEPRCAAHRQHNVCQLGGTTSDGLAGVCTVCGRAFPVRAGRVVEVAPPAKRTCGTCLHFAPWPSERQPKHPDNDGFGHIFGDCNAPIPIAFELCDDTGATTDNRRDCPCWTEKK